MMWTSVGPALAATQVCVRRVAVAAARRNASGVLNTQPAGLTAFVRLSGIPARRFASATATKPARKTTAKGAAKGTTTKSKGAAKSGTAAPKKKAAAPKKKTTKKTAKKAADPKKPKRKVVSPEKKALADRRALRKVALLYQEPKNLPASAYLVFSTSKSRGKTIGRDELGNLAKETGAEYRNLSDSERESYKATAIRNKATNEANYKSWVESFTPREIYDANRARGRLHRVYKVESGIKPILDERVPKRAPNAYAQYIKDRYAGGFQGESNVAEAARALAREWKNLSEAQKTEYQNAAKSAHAKHEKQLQQILGADYKKASPTAAAV